MAFKRALPNYDLPDKLPIAKGYIYNNSLVIRRCPLCGLSHDHGLPKKHPIGYLTIRSNHCGGRSELMSEYIIRIVGRINEAQYENTRKRNEKYDKLKFDNIHPPKPDDVEYIKSSEYIAICEERGSWI